MVYGIRVDVVFLVLLSLICKALSDIYDPHKFHYNLHDHSQNQHLHLQKKMNAASNSFKASESRSTQTPNTYASSLITCSTSTSCSTVLHVFIIIFTPS